MQITSQQTDLGKTGNIVHIAISLVGKPGSIIDPFMIDFQDWSLSPHGQVENTEAWGSNASWFFSSSTVSHEAMPSRLTEHQIVSILRNAKKQIDLERAKGNMPMISIRLNAHGRNLGDDLFVSFGDNRATPSKVIESGRFFSSYAAILDPIIQNIHKKVNIQKLNEAQAALIQNKIKAFLLRQSKKIMAIVSPNRPITDDEKRIQIKEARKWNPKISDIKDANDYVDEIANNSENDVRTLEDDLDALIPELKQLDTAKSKPYTNPNGLVNASVYSFQNEVQKYFPERPINTAQSLARIISEELKLSENQLPINITLDACDAGAGTSMLRFLPKGSVVSMPVNKTQSSNAADEANRIRNSANFTGTDHLRFIVHEPLRRVKNARKNVSPILAFKNKEGKEEIYDFQELLPDFMGRVQAMSDDDMDALEQKFVQEYSPNDEGFRFNHFERIVQQIGHTANRYEISTSDQKKLKELLGDRNRLSSEYIKISNDFYDNHQKIRRIKPRRATFDINNQSITYDAARSMLLPIFLHAAQNLGELELIKLFNREYSKEKTESLREKLSGADKSSDDYIVSGTYVHSTLDMVLKSSHGETTNVLEISAILAALRNLIIDKYMEGTPNPSIESEKLLIENEFHYTLKDQFKDTEEGIEAQLAFHNLKSILRGDIPIENPLFNMRDLRDDFNESFVEGERAVAKRLFAQLRSFRKYPERADLEEVLDMRIEKNAKVDNRRKVLDYLVTLEFEAISLAEITEIFSFTREITKAVKTANKQIEQLRKKDYGHGFYDSIESETEMQKIAEFLKSDFYKNASEGQKKERLGVIIETLDDLYKGRTNGLVDDLENAVLPNTPPAKVEYPDIDSLRRVALMALIADSQEEMLGKVNEARARDLPSLVMGDLVVGNESVRSEVK